MREIDHYTARVECSGDFTTSATEGTTSGDEGTTTSGGENTTPKPEPGDLQRTIIFIEKVR